MQLIELVNRLDANLGYDHDQVEITVHTGGHEWEEIVDVVYCDECKQYHIISERIKNGTDTSES